MESIVNIKISVKLFLPYNSESLVNHVFNVNKNFNKYCQIKKINNMLIVKSTFYVYIIFLYKKFPHITENNFNKFHCNITGIKSIHKIENARDHLLSLFFSHLEDIQSEIVIDSITSKFNHGKELNIHTIYKNLKHLKVENKKLNLHTFPSLKIRFKELGSVQLYSSGKCILLGQKSSNDILIIKNEFEKILNNKNDV